MDTKIEKPKSNGLRTRVGTKSEDNDECQSTQKSLARASRMRSAQDDMAKGMESTRLVKSDGKPAKTSSTSNPQSRSPTPPADGSLANFGVVIPGVYRSAWPTPEAHDFARGLQLKTIITLVEKDEPDAEYTAFIKKNGINQLVFDIEGTKKASIPAETMRDVLDVVLDKTYHPVLVHCNRGRHRTGCTVGVLRKLFGWDLDSVLSEYHSFADPKPRDSDIKYLTAIEPAKLFATRRQAGGAPMRVQGTFTQLLSFTLFVSMIWFISIYRIATNISETRHG